MQRNVFKKNRTVFFPYNFPQMEKWKCKIGNNDSPTLVFSHICFEVFGNVLTPGFYLLFMKSTQKKCDTICKNAFAPEWKLRSIH